MFTGVGAGGNPWKYLWGSQSLVLRVFKRPMKVAVNTEPALHSALAPRPAPLPLF